MVTPWALSSSRSIPMVHLPVLWAIQAAVVSNCCSKFSDCPGKTTLVGMAACGRRGLSVELAVAQQHLVIGLQAAGKFFGQIHRAVFAAGAADGDGYVAAAFLLQFGQAAADKGFDVGKHFAGFILGGQIAAHAFVAAGLLAQAVDVIGIRESFSLN